jgi:hypothetical protein
MNTETTKSGSSLSLFMTGPNSDAEKDLFRRGYDAAMKDKDLVDWPVVRAYIDQGESACNADDAVAFLVWSHKNGWFNTGTLEDGTTLWAKTDSTAAVKGSELYKMFKPDVPLDWSTFEADTKKQLEDMAAFVSLESYSNKIYDNAQTMSRWEFLKFFSKQTYNS